MIGEEMNIVMLYWSHFGNGKRIIECLDKTLTDKKVSTEVIQIDDANPQTLPKADVYVFSAPAEAFSIARPMKSFMKKLEGMDGAKYGIINTHGMKRNWLGTMEKILSKKQMMKVAALDFRIEGDAKTGNALPHGWEDEVKSFAELLHNPKDT